MDVMQPGKADKVLTAVLRSLAPQCKQYFV